MKWIKANERLPDKDYSFAEDEFGQFPIRWEFEMRTVIATGFLKDGVIYNCNSNKPHGDCDESLEWLDETPPPASVHLGKKVYHTEIYNGKELMEIVGIRKDTVELEGDYSGGTHKVCQKDWLSIEGIIEPEKL